MIGIDSIRKYFSPIQPSVKAGYEKVLYEEFEPPPELRDYIHCYWQLRTNQHLESPYNYRVVSDGCIDVFFNLKSTSESFVMGFCNKFTEFSIGNEFDYAGIRFYPSIFPQLFDVSAKTLSNKDQALESILPKLAELISTQIQENFALSIPTLDTYLMSIVDQKTTPVDNRFQGAFFEILKKKGNIETERELDIGLSPRQLRRLFNYYVGTTPKSFCQVVRFQYILNAKPSSQSLKENKIYFDVGFYDQAHFIKTFTKFYGVTPTKAFR